jgi:DNA repair protein RecN (Recombination protein N)
LKVLPRASQVPCVTRLAQIATFADHYYLIEKKSTADRTRTAVRLITGEARTEEVARMLSGGEAD